MEVFIDLETYHPDGLKAVPFEQYVREAQIILAACSVDGAEPEVFEREELDRFRELLERADRVYGFNILAFDARIIQHDLGLDVVDKCVDLMHMARTAGFQGDLDKVTSTLADHGLTTAKKMAARGKQLVNRFCKRAPRNHSAGRYTKHNSPSEWTEFRDYARTDVVVLPQMLNAFKRLDVLKAWDYDRFAREMDADINRRGVPVDIELCKAAVEMEQVLRPVAEKRFHELTGGTGPRQVAALLKWLDDRGVNLDNLRADTINQLLTTERDRISDDVAEVLELRTVLARNNAAKYAKALGEALHGDGRAFYTLSYYGARTGRWAGRRIQPQNMARSERVVELCERVLARDNSLTLSELSEATRGLIKAPPGRLLVSGDLSNIEGRMLAWLAGEKELLKGYAENRDAYKLTYSICFGVPYEEVDKEQRFTGKVLDLACQYRGGLQTLSRVILSMTGKKVETAVVERLLNAYRNSRKNTVNLWLDTERAWDKALKFKGKAVRCADGRVAFLFRNNIMRCRLPSGRVLYYPLPKDRSYLDTAAGCVKDVHGGVLVENVVQAASRDVLVHAAQVLYQQRGHVPAVLTVHDEIILEVDEDEAQRWFDDLIAALRVVPKWAAGLPLDAAGWVDSRYKKD